MINLFSKLDHVYYNIFFKKEYNTIQYFLIKKLEGGRLKVLVLFVIKLNKKLKF